MVEHLDFAQLFIVGVNIPVIISYGQILSLESEGRNNLKATGTEWGSHEDRDCVPLTLYAQNFLNKLTHLSAFQTDNPKFQCDSFQAPVGR